MEQPDFQTSCLRNCRPLDYEAVFSAALAGDPCAVRLRERGIEVWAAVGVSLIHAYDPEAVVYGGGIMASGESTLSPIRSIIECDAWTPWGKPPVVASGLGNDAALIACEWLLEERRL
jgi:glucokinase